MIGSIALIFYSKSMVTTSFLATLSGVIYPNVYKRADGPPRIVSIKNFIQHLLLEPPYFFQVNISTRVLSYGQIFLL